MARSTYIYIAYDQDRTIITVGTVKKEVIKFVKQHLSRYPQDRCREIRRYMDCRGGMHNFLDLDEELGKHRIS